MLKAITDRRVQEKLASVIDTLENQTELQVETADDDLTGYRTVRAVGPR